MSSGAFILAERFVRVDAPADSAFAGFWAEVRQNLSNGERRLLIEHLDTLQAETEATARPLLEESTALGEAAKAGSLEPESVRVAVATIEANTTEINRLAAAMHQRANELIAPHVRDWNVYQPGEDGTPVKVAPPAEAGPAAFDAITDEMALWLRASLLAAYRSGKGVTTPSPPRGGSPPPTGGPRRGPGKARNMSATPCPQTSSSGLLPSMYQA